MMNNLSFISNNVKGLQAISKRIKISEYLKNYVTSNGFIFLQETHSSVIDEKIWNDEFEGQLFFSHGKTNSCGVAIDFVGTKALNILNIKRDNLGPILVIDVKIDDSVFVLINIYNANYRVRTTAYIKRSYKHSRNFRRYSKQKCCIRW